MQNHPKGQYKLEVISQVKATGRLSKKESLQEELIIVQFLKEHIDIFESAEKDYGVSKFYIASIIGMETNYGTYYGSIIL